MTLSGVIAVAVICAVSVPGGAWGQDKQPEPRGKIVRDAPDALRVEDMTMEELQQRLAEYEAGKRDYRDGYIILNQLWFNYQAQRKTDSPEFQAVANKREDLLKKHPELNNLQDFRLSEKVNRETAEKKSRSAELTKAKRWKPTDSRFLRVFGSGSRAVAMHQYRLEFYNLPGDVRLARGKNTDRLRLFRGDDELSPSRLQPHKTMTFKVPVEVFPVLPDDISGPFLACTNPIARYTPASADERKTMALLGHTHGMPWTNPAGQYGHFCGLISTAGEIVYQFPFTSSVPNNVMAPLKMTPDGTWAAVMIGQVVEGEDIPGIGKPREVWIWRAPNKLEKYMATDSSPLVRELLQYFQK